MTDPLLIAGAITSAPLVLDVYKRLLGPSLDALGDSIRAGLNNRTSNVHKVAERADAKLTGDATGSIPPRVASEVFEKAQWADDEFVAEYLSGVLASSRTPEGKDDRGVTWTALVGRLSADQLRLHYIIYREFRRLGRGVEFEALTEVLAKPIIFTQATLIRAMGLPREVESLQRILEAAYGLSAEGLLEERLGHGPADFMSKIDGGQFAFPSDVGDFLMVYATTRGASLYLHAHGLGSKWATAILDPNINLDIEWPEDQNVPDANGQWKEDFRKPTTP